MSAEEEETLMTKIKASVRELSSLGFRLFSVTSSFDNQAEESLGMAQTFSVVTTLIECMAEVVENRIKQKQAAKAKKEADEEEVSRACPPDSLI